MHRNITITEMSYTIKDFEIMAPVGSRESLAAALHAGADSIYFGIESLNMRARSASTFTIDDLREIAKICDEHGVKSYLTINTIIYDEDIALMRKIVDAAKEAGISAVIAADVAVMAYCNEVGQEVHLSTQLNISNAEALKFYSRFADVVVLARELNLKQVRKIYDAIQEQQIKGPMGELVRIEMFCHGALCMAVSGKCYLSLNELNASANRGACMQVCRRAYTVKDKESDIELEVDNQYIMSPKDLKTIHFMDEMIEAGVRVFKIEGRARGPEYVRTVVECYKEAIQSYIDGTFSDEKVARGASIDSVVICGKTGTAQNPHGEDHSIFMAFAPKDNPKIVIAIYIENGGFGAQYAVPIGGLIMEKYLKGKIAPRKKAIEERMLNSNLIIPETPKKEQHLKTAEEKQNEED